MSTMTYIILALVILIILGAAYVIYNDRRKGKNCCGYRCSDCGTCSPLISLPDETTAQETELDDTISEPEGKEEN